MKPSPLSASSADMVANVLAQVISQGTPLDRSYAQHFAGKYFSEQEKAKVTLVTGDIFRRLNLFCFLADISMDNAAEYATSLVSAWHLMNQLPQPAVEAGTRLNENKFQTNYQQAKKDKALWDGCPQWLNELGETQLAASWPAVRAALAKAPKRYIRANELKTSAVELAQLLRKEKVETKPVSNVKTALEVTSTSALFQTQAYKNGLFEQQDAGSQLVADALDVKPGMRVFDACAGNGGKTLHIAAQMQGKGRLVAMDVEQWKLDNLKKRARRAGTGIIETRIIESSKTIKRRKESADRLLLDVPCSGLGVLRRKPGAKWHDTQERITVLIELQRDILHRYSQLLKVGGVLVYATCSILPAENRQQIDRFLANNTNFRLLEDQTISPADFEFDGFYWAKIERIG